jgi:hypothetical protein
MEELKERLEVLKETRGQLMVTYFKIMKRLSEINKMIVKVERELSNYLITPERCVELENKLASLHLLTEQEIDMELAKL